MCVRECECVCGGVGGGATKERMLPGAMLK